MLFKLFVIKSLNKLNILKYLNLCLSRSYNNITFYVPIIYKLGYVNFLLKKDWLDDLISGLVKSDNVFVDVGVNVGQTLLKCKSINPNIKYLGFEPNASCVFYVQQLIKKNNFTDCTVHNCALATGLQTLALEKTHIDDSRASIVSNLRPGHLSSIENVIALNFDSLFSSNKIDFIKIDVEGAELDVLLGMSDSIKKHQPIIFCEVLDSHSADTFEFTQKRASNVSKFIKDNNYAILKLETNGALGSLASYKVVTDIVIKQWTRKSLSENDYIFVPNSQLLNIIGKLDSILI